MGPSLEAGVLQRDPVLAADHSSKGSDQLQTFCTSGVGQCSIQCSNRRRQANREVEVRGVIGRQAVLARKPDYKAFARVSLNPNRQAGKVVEKHVRVGRIDTAAPLIDDQDVPNFEPPEGRHDRVIMRQPIYRGVRSMRRLVIKAPRCSDRSVENERHQGRRPSSRADRTSATDTEGRPARARFIRSMILPVSSRVPASIPTSRAMGTPRRVIVTDSPRSTNLSSSGRRVFASYEPTVCMVFSNWTNSPVYLYADSGRNRKLERIQASPYSSRSTVLCRISRASP